MKHQLVFLCIIFPMLSSCILGNPDDLFVYRCKDANFTFYIHEREDGHVLIFSDKDSVKTDYTSKGDYYGLNFYLLDSAKTIYLKGESAGFELEKPGSNQLRLVVPPPYKTVSHKYKIKHIKQNVDIHSPHFLERDLSVLGDDYWWFEGNVSERGGGYSFTYGHSKKKGCKTVYADGSFGKQFLEE